MRELLRDFGDVRYVWRHLPLNDVHPRAQLAAEAAEAAAAQGPSGRCTTCCSTTRTRSARATCSATPSELGLDVERFTSDLREHAGAGRVAEDVDSADLSGVSGTPTFFINGRRHYGAYDIATLSAEARTTEGAFATGELTTRGYGHGMRRAICSSPSSRWPPPAVVPARRLAKAQHRSTCCSSATA